MVVRVFCVFALFFAVSFGNDAQAQDNAYHVFLINPSGNLIQRTVMYDEGTPPQGRVIANTQSALQIVIIFHQRDLDGSAGGPFTDVYQGNSLYSISETTDGTALYMYDVTPASLTVRPYSNNGQPMAQRIIDPKLAASAVQGATWDTLDDGQGTYYESKVAEAMAIMGL